MNSILGFLLFVISLPVFAAFPDKMSFTGDLKTQLTPYLKFSLDVNKKSESLDKARYQGTALFENGKNANVNFTIKSYGQNLLKIYGDLGVYKIKGDGFSKQQIAGETIELEANYYKRDYVCDGPGLDDCRTETTLEDYGKLTLLQKRSPEATTINQMDSIATNEDMFGKLEKLFATGTAATEQSTTGWFSGRCYMVYDRTHPVNALLVGHHKIENSKNPTGKFKVISIQVVYESPDFFDNIADSYRTTISSYINEQFPYMTEARIADNSLVGEFEPGNIQYQIRKSGNLFINKSVVVQNADQYKAGDTYAYCFYSKKIN